MITTDRPHAILERITADSLVFLVGGCRHAVILDARQRERWNDPADAQAATLEAATLAEADHADNCRTTHPNEGATQ